MKGSRYFPAASVADGIVWPAFPNTKGQRNLALLYQLQNSEWLPAEEIERRQYVQLSRLANYAARRVPFYRERLVAAKLPMNRLLTPSEWRRVPLLSREDIQDQGQALRSQPYPKSHGNTATISTSGSTGKPVTVVSTEVTGYFFAANSLRDHVWHQRDLSTKFAAIRRFRGSHLREAQTIAYSSWGVPVVDTFRSGPGALLSINTDVPEQLNWLLKEQPAYLLTYPTNLKELLAFCSHQGQRLPGLRQVRTMGEIVSPDLRRSCRDVLGVELADMYSAQECGYLALQCPGYDHYLVQSESVLLEVLREDGLPCSEGETGRVIVTPLTNFAMPLLRYDIGDYATVGGSSPCGRGLPVLTRILGRVRNMLITPDGKRIWPAFGGRKLVEVAPIGQLQFIQQDRTRIEAKIVPLRPLSDGEQEALIEHLESHLPNGMRIVLSFVDHIPRSEGGKYEDFVCNLPD